MQVFVASVEACIKKAREITEHYDQLVLSKGFPRSVDDLKEVVQTYMQLTEIRLGFLPEISYEGRSLRGCFLSNDNHVEIYLLDGMSFCWNRLVEAKELFHTLLESDDNREMEIFKHIQEVVTKWLDLEFDPSNAAEIELLAEVAAMEFLFPYSERLNHRHLAEKGGKPIDFVTIAHEYKIPLFCVERYMSDSFMDTLKDI